MTKKDFINNIKFVKYTGSNKDANVNAIFFDHQVVRDETKDSDPLFGKPIIGRGFKYCFYSRAINATKKQLIDYLYGYVTEKTNIYDIPYYVQTVIAQTDEQRFRVPLMGSGLTKLIKYPMYVESK